MMYFFNKLSQKSYILSSVFKVKIVYLSNFGLRQYCGSICAKTSQIDMLPIFQYDTYQYWRSAKIFSILFLIPSMLGERESMKEFYDLLGPKLTRIEAIAHSKRNSLSEAKCKAALYKKHAIFQFWNLFSVLHSTFHSLNFRAKIDMSSGYPDSLGVQ